MIKESRVDLHVHSNYSDGLDSPGEIIAKTSAAGLEAVALTDHETIAGWHEAADASCQAGIEFVPGVEISALFEANEVHILGYYPRHPERISCALEGMRTERMERMERIALKLKSMRMAISLEEILTEAGKAAPGRMHVARLMLKKKYVHTLREAFSLYLDPERPAYVARRIISAAGAVDLLKEAEAIPVIAHPGPNGDRVIAELIPMGLLGIEAFHPGHNNSLSVHYCALAARNGLLITGGSDYHGEELKLSSFPQHLAISASYLEKMKNFLNLR